MSHILYRDDCVTITKTQLIIHYEDDRTVYRLDHITSVRVVLDKDYEASARQTIFVGLLLSCMLIGIPIMLYGIWLLSHSEYLLLIRTTGGEARELDGGSEEDLRHICSIINRALDR